MAVRRRFEGGSGHLEHGGALGDILELVRVGALEVGQGGQLVRAAYSIQLGLDRARLEFGRVDDLHRPQTGIAHHVLDRAAGELVGVEQGLVVAVDMGRDGDAALAGGSG